MKNWFKPFSSERKCPMCGRVGKIVDCRSSKKYLDITRKCMNKECDLGQDEGLYPEHLRWNDIITIAELEECKKWLEENAESLLKKKEKGESIPACEGYPQPMKCWKQDCDKSLEVCRYPFYICNNKHVLNIVTGETWFWKGTVEEYHDLRRVESCLDKVNEVLERKKKEREENRLK